MKRIEARALIVGGVIPAMGLRDLHGVVRPLRIVI